MSASRAPAEVVRAIALSREAALLGEPVSAELSLLAPSGAPASTPTLEHASLTLELGRPPGGEPEWWFPNCGTEVIDDEPVRTGSNGGTAALAAGERRALRLALERGFPVALLDVGARTVAFTLGAGAATVRAGPVPLRITSGPGAVPHLFARVATAEISPRRRAAALLRRMTGRGLDHDDAGPEPARRAALAAWRAWWDAEGSRLPWRAGASRAGFEAEGGAPGAAGPPERLGGVVLPRAALAPKARWELLRLLEAWTPAAPREGRAAVGATASGTLPGAALVGDGGAVAWPAGGGNVECDPAIEAALRGALERLAAAAGARPEECRRDGALLVATAARAPSEALVPALSRLEREVPRGAPGWAPAIALAGGLLDWLEEGRVRVGASG